ncbi:hypothetical protein J3R30DRAFT_2283329 [Lentinula aciculospora]|uniref:Uncharacterized protein n=1 Tax=Lentinula aciculospora TaxID=153920 RepID=A0A9W8ZT46_9AGAR|nr:hypothetical protein J3R30DRAFT_2283329 [Lentinula aciculospora]
MQTPTRERVGGYSDFFSSGFRAIPSKITASRPRHSSIHSLPSIPSDLIRSMSSSRRRSVDGGNKSRPPPLQSLKGKANSQLTISTPLANEKRKKRSSFIEFSTRLFDKKTSGVSEEQSFVEFDDTQRRLRPRSHHSLSDWSKLGMSVPVVNTHVSSIPTFYPDSNEIDPFNSSPEAKSFFIDLSDSSSLTSPSSPRRPRYQSFMSFSGSSLSSLTSFTRRERPTSIHSLSAVDPISWTSTRTKHPLSRSPSNHPSNFDKADFSFQEESSVSESPYEIDDRNLANIDWREFHIQLLDNV